MKETIKTTTTSKTPTQTFSSIQRKKGLATVFGGRLKESERTNEQTTRKNGICQDVPDVTEDVSVHNELSVGLCIDDDW